MSVVVSTFGAYSFARLNYPGRGLFSRGVLLVYMFSGILLVVPLFKIIVWMGLVDNLGSLVITYLVQTLPVSLYMLGNYFRSVPPEIEEAAMMDGYSRLEVIFRITLPLSATRHRGRVHLHVHDRVERVPLRQHLPPVPIDVHASYRSGRTLVRVPQVWGQIMAASLLTSIPIIIMFVYLEKYMVEGLTFGSVEG
ncbi:carbohydrate ABC transporter permease [Haladaptatus sp. W1]|uniref:carbohydrate ABC transporter permease n=1 Tax=Haladaptatus sp. W1 TaxID=1897478 RepID=UPI000AE425BA|nr:carbohydrate ABC transporter permease [Haladaptatus sp. W1]